MTRSRSEGAAPLCTRCRLPMAAGLDENTHPACDSSMSELRAAQARAIARGAGR